MNPRLALLALPLAVTACVVLPMDPVTGQPYGMPPPLVVTAPAPAPALPPPPAVIGVRLYPLNDVAARIGPLQALVFDQRGGRGTFSVNYGGDTLQGEATRVLGHDATFGRVHAEVLGAPGRDFAGERGIANAAGPRGASVQCEYLFSAPGRGTGVCLFSDGARYRMHFGG